MDEDTRDYLRELERRIDWHLDALNEAVEQRDRFLLREHWAVIGVAIGLVSAWLIGKGLDWLGVKDGFLSGVLFWVALLAWGAVVSRFLIKAQREDEGKLYKLPKWQTQAPQPRR